MRLGVLAGLLAVGGVGAQAADAAAVEGMRVWSGPDATRVVLDLSAPLEHRIFTLSGPDRVVIDLQHAELATELDLPERKGFLTAVRSGVRGESDLRVVLELSRSVQPKSFLLAPNDTYGDRLVIDLPAASGEAVVKRAPRPSPGHARPVLVAIDAGHGGEDPGASGPHGVREKDVVLAIARDLAELVRREPGMEPMLIRDGDYVVSLRERSERARHAAADLFVSIHADAYRNGSAKGATVYALSEKGASDEAAKRLAARENASDLIGGVSLADKDQLLARVLLDLSQSAAISASMNVGGHVIERLGPVAPLRKTDVQQAPFLVLKSPDIPSILIETGYISNPKEEGALNDPRHQHNLARAIHAGILDYFRANPPEDSYLALNPPKEPRVPLEHRIARGETLSEIAVRYHVSLAKLMEFNRLRNDVVRIGQVVVIPST